MFMRSYERNVQSVHNAMHHLGDASPLPIVGAQHASPDEAHGAVDSASGCLGHHGAGSSRNCATRDGSCRWMSPSVAVLTGAEFPLAPPTTRGGGM